VTMPAADPRTRPIAVFDSGVGGLTVLHELLVQLPEEDFLYLGDTARFPYGERSRTELERFSLQIAEELLARGAKLLVVACNSATAAALPALRRRMMETTLGVDVLGVVRPEAVQAVTATHTGRIGLLATPATVASGAYAQAIAAADPHVDLVAVACPDLAPIIQGGFPFDDAVVDTVRGYVTPLRKARVDTVILGCTHYPLVRPLLQRMLGRGVRIITPGAALARQVEHVLGSRGLGHPRGDGAARVGPGGGRPGDGGPGDGAHPPVEGEYRFLCTGDTGAFRALGTRFLQMPLGAVEHVDLRTEALA
jgi:glutamate racemase